jgi:hypothetical protein
MVMIDVFLAGDGSIEFPGGALRFVKSTDSRLLFDEGEQYSHRFLSTPLWAWNGK